MKITNASLKALLWASFAGFATSQGVAGSAQITVPVNDTTLTWGAPNASNISDNTVSAPNAYQGQAWDLEAFTATTASGPTHSSLSLVAGYNLAATNGAYGVTGTGSSYYGTGGGDIFISLSGGATPQPSSGGAYETYANNTLAATGSGSATQLIYNYVIDTHQGMNANGTFNVYQLGASSVLTGVENPQFLSSPWIYDPTKNGNSSTVFTTVSYNYYANQSAAQVANAAETGVFALSHLADDSAGNTNWDTYLLGQINPATGLNWTQAQITAAYASNADHNVLTIDMSNLSTSLAVSNSLYFSYTMECGNDSIKGASTGGFSQIAPDGGSTLILLGSALALLHFVRRKQAA